MFDLQGARVLVAGGSSGIGLATARLLIECGAAVVVSGRNRSKLESVQLQLGARASISTFDAANAQERARALGEIGRVGHRTSSWGRISRSGRTSVAADDRFEPSKILGVPTASSLFGGLGTSSATRPSAWRENDAHILGLHCGAAARRRIARHLNADGLLPEPRRAELEVIRSWNPRYDTRSRGFPGGALHGA